MQRYLLTLKTYWLLFLLILAGFTVIISVTTRPAPAYTARTGLWLDQPIYFDTNSTKQVELLAGTAQNYAFTLTSLLSSHDFLEQVADKLEEAGYRFSPALRNRVLEQVYFGVKSKVIGQNLLILEYEADDPQFARAVLQAVTSNFTGVTQQFFLNRGQGMIEYLKSQVGQAQSEYEKTNRQAVEYLSTNPGRDPYQTNSFLSDEDLQRSLILQTRAQALSRYEQLRNNLEQLQIGFDNVSEGRGTLVNVRDQPVITGTVVFDNTARMALGAGVGLAGGSLLAVLLLLVLTWTDASISGPAAARQLLGLKFAVELPVSRVTKAQKLIFRRYPAQSFKGRNLRRTILVTGLGAGLLAAVVLLSYRQPPNAVVVPLIALLVVLIFRYPAVGLALELLLMLVCETFPSPDGFSTYTTIPLRNFNSFTTLPLSFNPLEIILAWTLMCAIFHSIKDHKRFFDSSVTTRLVILLASFMAFGYSWGVFLNQGDSKAATVEIRALLYLLIVYFLAVYFLQDRRFWPVLDWIIPSGLSLLSLTTILRFFILSGDTYAGLSQESLSGFNHDNSILFVMLVMWCLNKIVFSGSLGPRLAGMALLAPPIFGIMVSGRRAAFASLAICLMVFLLILFVRRRKIFFITAAILLVIVPPYLIVFKNASGPLGLAARAFNSSSAEVGSRDFNSNLYRLVEKINVRLTIREAPLTGKGFGQQFTRYNQLVDLEVFEFQYFTPHVQVLWLWLKLGVVGWVVFWLLVAGSLFRLGQIIKFKGQGQLFSISITVGCIITSIMVFAYLDLSLINIRLMTLMGLSIALLEIAHRNLPAPVPAKERPVITARQEPQLAAASPV